VYYSGGATQLLQSVTVDQEEETGVATLTVEQMTWDWTNNAPLITPAAQVTITVGEWSAVTDEHGKATMDLPAGEHEAILTGYAEGAAPTLVRSIWPLEINRVDVDVTVQVEGPAAPIGAGAAAADNALEAIEVFFKENTIPYETTVYSFGTSIDAVDGIASGSFGGWDGWLYAVKRGEEWIHPVVSLDTFVVEEMDHIVLYYGNGTKVIDSVEVTPETVIENKSFSVKVTTAEWDWAANAEVLLPAAGVQVSVGDLQAVTNESGIAHFAGLTSGSYEVIVDGYQEGSVPTVVRTSLSLDVNEAAK
jgi:hypothetical protein